MPWYLRIFPFLAWFKQWNGATLRADLIAGISVALVLIPQSMAYAQLAGLPAFYGLYAAVLPPIVASLFGSSNQLATGPVAVVSLMTAATLEPLATAGGPQYIQYALLLALLVGLFQFALGVLRLGLIVNFLSHPVVNGFTNAAALIIATSQLSKIFGVTVEKAHHHYETVYRVVVAGVEHLHWPTLGMGVLAFGVMIGLKRVSPRIPNVLVVVLLTTLMSWGLGFSSSRVSPLSSIQSEELAASVSAFNEALARKEAAELAAEADSGSAAPADASVPEDAAHGEAAEGADELALATLELRAAGDELKGYRLLAADSAGEPRLYPAGELPDGLEAEGPVWRVRCADSPIDLAAVPLFGGGAIVGAIPEGLPPMALPTIDWTVAARLFTMAMIISLIGFMEAISIARAMAARTQQRLDPNQELVGQGLSNIVGSMASSYPVSGSFSRSAVCLQAGGVTGLSNVISTFVVVIVLLFLTPTLYHLPQAVLAAIIMMAVIGLVNVKGFVHAWKAQRFDGLTSVITFVATLYFAPHLEWGILLGVVLTLGNHLFRTMRPRVVELSLCADGSLRDAERHGLERCEHIAAIRFVGPLNFVNTAYLEDMVLQIAADRPHLRHVLIAGHGISEVDASGEDMLARIVRRFREAGIDVSFSGLNDQVLDVLRRTHLLETIGEDNLSPTQIRAIKHIHPKAHANSTEKRCPLVEPVYRDPAAAHTDAVAQPERDVIE